GTKIVLVIERDDRVDDRAEEVEAGIAMIYFEVAMHDIGLPGHWKTDDLSDADKYQIPENHFIGGYYTF
ncbi:nitroreductase family protein, partial [Aduncisulcus paluster]